MATEPHTAALVTGDDPEHLAREISFFYDEVIGDDSPGGTTVVSGPHLWVGSDGKDHALFVIQNAGPRRSVYEDHGLMIV